MPDDDLRTRIAAVLDQHKTDPHDEWTCQCNSTGIRWADHVADAVIREIGLSSERRHPIATESGIKVGNWMIPTQSRYVTEWLDDE